MKLSCPEGYRKESYVTIMPSKPKLCQKEIKHLSMRGCPVSIVDLRLQGDIPKLSHWFRSIFCPKFFSYFQRKLSDTLNALTAQNPCGCATCSAGLLIPKIFSYLKRQMKLNWCQKSDTVAEFGSLWAMIYLFKHHRCSMTPTL